MTAARAIAAARGAMAAALVLALVPLAGCDGWGVRPNLERMIDQHRADPYGATEYFADGRVMRTPPPHTVPRERVLNASPYTDGMRLGAYVTTVPVPVTAALLARGRERFDITCAACHGTLGDGVSKAAEHMVKRRPRSLHDAEVRAYPPGRIFETITRGYGLMPALTHQLSIEDRWAIVAYVEALQLSQSVSLSDLPDPVRREAEEVLR